jgi:hypothetical protein
MHTSSTLDKVTSDLFPKGCAILISPDRCICCYEGVRCSKLHVFVNLEVGLASATALLGASDKPLVSWARRSSMTLVLLLSSSFVSRKMRRMTRKQDNSSHNKNASTNNRSTKILILYDDEKFGRASPRPNFGVVGN